MKCRDGCVRTPPGAVPHYRLYETACYLWNAVGDSLDWQILGRLNLPWPFDPRGSTLLKPTAGLRVSEESCSNP